VLREEAEKKMTLGNIWATFREHSGNIQGQSGNIQKKMTIGWVVNG
jgi:hypothetical protein